MKINDNLNYCILGNNIDKEFLSKFLDYQIIEGNYSFLELENKLKNTTSKQIVFHEIFYNLRNNELKRIIELLKEKDIKYINITTNVEQAIFSDYIIVYDGKNKIIEGPRDNILKEEKTLKKLGIGVPFATDLSIQLNYYDILNKVYFDIDSLVEDLWN